MFMYVCIYIYVFISTYIYTHKYIIIKIYIYMYKCLILITKNMVHVIWLFPKAPSLSHTHKCPGGEIMGLLAQTDS